MAEMNGRYVTYLRSHDLPTLKRINEFHFITIKTPVRFLNDNA